jgi:drug/metabolite transporter (DMT)-like permease
MSISNNSNKLLQLHTIILLWGFTPVIGKFISLQATDLVWYRLLFAGISLMLYMKYKGIKMTIPLKESGMVLLMGAIVGIHWYFFYHAIKVSNVSVALAGFSTITFFASILQPLMLKKKFFWGDVFYGILMLVGLIIILRFDAFNPAGLVYGILAAVTAAIFGIYNGKLIEQQNAATITLFEFGGAFVVLSVMKFLSSDSSIPPLNLSDLGGLLFLSILCTTLAFTWSVEILKHFTPLTVIITNNLEPLYGIGFSVLLFGDSEYMSGGFYIGAAIILVSVFTYPFVKKRYYN